MFRAVVFRGVMRSISDRTCLGRMTGLAGVWKAKSKAEKKRPNYFLTDSRKKHIWNKSEDKVHKGELTAVSVFNSHGSFPQPASRQEPPGHLGHLNGWLMCLTTRGFLILCNRRGNIVSFGDLTLQSPTSDARCHKEEAKIFGCKIVKNHPEVNATSHHFSK